MQFGVQFFPAVDHTDKRAADYYAKSLAIAEEAEILGFRHLRTVEHYFTRYGGYSPNPIVFLAAMSQRTKTMRLVTGAVLPVFNHPFKLAGEIAMLDGISGGRLDVGFARAFLPHEFRRFGISPDELQARFREGLEQIELLLTQETPPTAASSIRSRTSPRCRADAEAAPQFLHRGDADPGFVRVRGPPRLFADDNPDRPDQAPAGALSRVWRDAGHRATARHDRVHMFCHEDARPARAIARPHYEYFRAMNESVGDWSEARPPRTIATTTRRWATAWFTFEGQIE